MSAICSLVTNSISSGIASIINAVNPFKRAVLLSPQEERDSALSRIQNLIDGYKKHWQDGMPELIRGERSWQNIFRQEFFTKLPSMAIPILVTGGLHSYCSPLSKIIGSSILVSIYSSLWFFAPLFNLEHDTLDENLQSLEEQLIQRYAKWKGNHILEEALCILFDLERTYEEMPKEERTPRQRYQLEALRDFITQVDPTPKSIGLHQKMLFQNLLDNGKTIENLKSFETIKSFWGSKGILHTSALDALQYLFDNMNGPLDCSQEGENYSFPNLTPINFPCRLYKLSKYSEKLSLLPAGAIRDAAVRRYNQLHRQLRDYYVKNGEEIFGSFKQFLFFSPNFKFLYSEVRRLNPVNNNQ